MRVVLRNGVRFGVRRTSVDHGEQVVWNSGAFLPVSPTVGIRVSLAPRPRLVPRAGQGAEEAESQEGSVVGGAADCAPDPCLTLPRLLVQLILQF